MRPSTEETRATADGGRKDRSTGALTRAALLTAAALPWFAVFSGTYGLYFYILAAAMLLAEWMLIPLLVLAASLGVLLLFVMPAGTIYAALRRPPAGWAAG